MRERERKIEQEGERDRDAEREGGRESIVYCHYISAENRLKLGPLSPLYICIPTRGEWLWIYRKAAVTLT